MDCGDFSNNETESKFIQSRYTARSYDLLCYDAVNIGKREICAPQDEAVIPESLKQIRECIGASHGLDSVH